MKKVRSLQSCLLRLRYAVFCFGKTFRTRKMHSPIKDVTTSLKDENTFTVINDEGEEVVCNVLFTFDCDDESRHYIVYTDSSKDSEGNVQVYASMCDLQYGDEMELLPIQTDEEWALIESILTDIQEKLKNEEPVDSADEDVEDNEEDGTLESLPVAIAKRLSDWSEKFHFPIGALLPYIVGIVLFWLVRNEQLPIWADAVFVFLELVLMKVSYNGIEDTHFVISWIITAYLYMANLMFLLDPLIAKLFRSTARVTFEPWGLRGVVIVVSIGFILRTRLKQKKRQGHGARKKLNKM